MKCSKLFVVATAASSVGLTGVASAAVTYSTAADVTAFSPGFVIGSPSTGTLTGVAETNQQQAEIIQTFVPSTSFKLTQFTILSGGKAGGSVTLHVYPINVSVTGQGGGNNDGFVNTAFSTDLLGGGAGLTTTVNGSGADQLVNFAFTGTDQVTLTAGVEYGFEVDSTAGNFSWERSAADQYPNGNIYVATSGTQKNQPGGSPQRDGYFAIYGSAVPEPASLATLALGGVTLLKRRRRA